jgi:hypothetical protein
MPALSLIDNVSIYGRGRRPGGRFGASQFPGDLLAPLRPFLSSDAMRRFSWSGRAVPDTARVSLPALATIEDQISIRPGSFLLYVTAFSQQAAGFRFQVYDKNAGKPIYSAIVSHTAGAGVQTLGVPAPLPFILPAPWMVSGDPDQSGLLTVQLTNSAAVANSAQVVLYFAARRQGACV